MTEKPIFTDRLKLKEVTLPVDTVKELADLIPKPDNKFHYRMDGDWQENRDVFRVNEGDGVISDYTFPDKSDMGKTQFATRKTYAKELNMFGNIVDKDVQFDRKTGKWKKLNLVQTIKSKFHKGDNIPGQVVEENGKFVLHTLEDKRPVGDSVKEAEMTTLQDAKVELGLKYRHVQHELLSLHTKNKILQDEVRSLKASIATLNAQIVALSIASSRYDDVNTVTTRAGGMKGGSPPPDVSPYGTITPTDRPKPSGDRPKSPPAPDRTPPEKNEELDKRGDDVIRQFHETLEKKKPKS